MMRSNILLLLLVLASHQVFAQSVPDYEKQLSAVQKNEFAITKKQTRRDVLKKVSKLYNLLRDSTKAAITAPTAPTQKFFDDVVLAVSYTYDADPSYVIHDHLPALIKKYPEQMKKAIEKLPKEKRAVLEKVLRIIDRENKVGNG